MAIDARTADIVSGLTNILTPEMARIVLIPILTQEGSLVPFAKKKRVRSESETLAQEQIKLWMPLLSKLDRVWTGWGSDLIHHGLEILSNESLLVERLAKSNSEDTQEEEVRLSSSFQMTLGM